MPALEVPDLSLVPTEAELGPGMHRSLTCLLDRVRGARQALPHLAALENGLARHGSKALQMIPPKGLPRLYHQLVTLPADCDDAPLRILRARVAAAFEAQRAAAVLPPPARQSSGAEFLDEDRLQVCEVSHSRFMAELQARRGNGGDTLPGQLPR